MGGLADALGYDLQLADLDDDAPSGEDLLSEIGDHVFHGFRPLEVGAYEPASDLEHDRGRLAHDLVLGPDQAYEGFLTAFGADRRIPHDLLQAP